MSKLRRLFFSLTIFSFFALFAYEGRPGIKQEVLSENTQPDYWFLLHRKSNKEFLYLGEPGSIKNSTLVKEFVVKTGIPNERPTPLHSLLGREFWLITSKRESTIPETGPFFLTLDIPTLGEEPFGPVPYEECNGQCNWVTPGEFGLHGVGEDSSKLSPNDPGSSGCIRHSKEDITYLYNLLDPQSKPVKYYISDL